MKKNTYIGGIILSLVIGLVCLGVVFTKGKDEVAEEVIIQDETPVVVSKDNLISYELMTSIKMSHGMMRLQHTYI